MKRSARASTIVAVLVCSVAAAAAQSYPAEWNDLTVEQVVAMVSQSETGTPEEIAHCEQLTSLMVERFGKDGTSAAEINPRQWELVCRRLRKVMAEQQKDALTDAITAAYIGPDGPTQALKVDGVAAVARAVRWLGKARGERVTVDLIMKTDLWEQSTPKALSWLATGFAHPADESDRPARRRLATFLRENQINAAGGVAGSVHAWRRLSAAVGPVLGVQEKKEWVQALRTRFVPPAGNVAQLTPAEVHNIFFLLLWLGDEDIKVLRADWVNGQASLEGLSPYWVADFGGNLPQEGQDAEDARRKLIDYVAATFLGTDEDVLSVTLKHWGRMAGSLKEGLTSEEKDLWASRLGQAFLPDEATLLSKSATDLQTALRPIAFVDPGWAGALASRWLAASPNREEATVNAIYHISKLASVNSNRTLAQAAEQWEPSWPDDSLSFSNLKHISRIFRMAGETEKAGIWARRALQRAVGTAEQRAQLAGHQLVAVAVLLREADLLDAGETSDQFALGIAEVATRGELGDIEEGEKKLLGSAVGSQQARDLLRTSLLDTADMPRMDVAEILSWSIRVHGDWRSWSAEIDQEIASATTSETKARWQIVRAYADTILSLPQTPTRAVPALKKVLTTDASEATRFEGLRRLSKTYTDSLAFDEAAALLQSVAGQFSGVYADEIARLEKTILRRKQAAAEQMRLSVERSAEVADAARISFLKRKLAEAEAEEDAAAIARYTRLLGEVTP